MTLKLISDQDLVALLSFRSGVLWLVSADLAHTHLKTGPLVLKQPCDVKVMTKLKQLLEKSSMLFLFFFFNEVPMAIAPVLSPMMMLAAAGQRPFPWRP